MEAAIRRSVMQRRGDVEAAEELAQYLESMGYNLDGESFYTKRTGPQFERYAATGKDPKSNRRTSVPQDDANSDDSDEESIDEDSDDSSSRDSYDGDSSDSEDDDYMEDQDSSDDDSVEYKRRSAKSKQRGLTKKKKTAMYRITKSTPRSSKTRRQSVLKPRRSGHKTGTGESSRNKANKVQVFRAREERPLPYVANDKKLLAVPVAESKRSKGFSRLFKRGDKKTKHIGEIRTFEASSMASPERKSAQGKRVHLSHLRSGKKPAGTSDKPKLVVPPTSSTEREEYAVTTQETTSSEWERHDFLARHPVGRSHAAEIAPSDNFAPGDSILLEQAQKVEPIEVSTTMNNGALGIPLKPTVMTPPPVVQDLGTHPSGGYAPDKPPEQDEIDREPRVAGQYGGSPKAVSRMIGGLGNILRQPGKEGNGNEGSKEKDESKVTKFFRRNFPTVQSSKPPPTSSFADHHVVAPMLLSPTKNNVKIEGMSLVKQSELLVDQELDDRMMKVIDVAELEGEPFLIQPEPSPRRQNRFGIGLGRGRSKSPFNRTTQKEWRSRSRSRNRSKSIEEKEPDPPKNDVPGPSVSFELPPQESRPNEMPNKFSQKTGRKKFDVGKAIGKLFTRKDKDTRILNHTDRSNKPLKSEEAMEIFQDGSFAPSYADKTKATLQTRSETLDDRTMEDSQQGDESCAEAEQDPSMIEGDSPEVFKVEVDSDANHAFDTNFTPNDSVKETKVSEKHTSEVQIPVPEASATDSAGGTGGKSDTKALVVESSGFYAAIGDFMCTTLAASNKPTDVGTVPYKFPLDVPLKTNAEEKVQTKDYETTIEMNRVPSKLEDKSHHSVSKTHPPLPSRSKSTSLPSRTKSTSRLIAFPTADDISFTPSLESLDIIPRPSEWRRAKPEVQPAVKSSTSKDPQKKGRNNIVKKLIPFAKRSRSMPGQSPKARDMPCETANEKALLNDGGPNENNAPAENSHVTESQAKKTTQTFEATVEPEVHATNKLYTSLRSPQSTTAIANPLSPSFALGEQEINCAVSGLQETPNLDVVPTVATKDWASIVEETDPRISKADGKSWAEVNKAANVLGKAMNHVGANTSADTTDEVQQLQRLLSNDSIGDIEHALQTLKRHAQRLGVPESDLLLATVKSEDTELMSVRSLTFGEELMDFMNTLVRGHGAGGEGTGGRRYK